MRSSCFVGDLLSYHTYVIRLLTLLFLPLLLAAEEHWVLIRSGPFEVFSSAGDKAAREQMMQLEQFRQGVADVLGKQDLRLVWPVRVLIFKNAKQMPPGADTLAMGRDARMAAAVEGRLLTRQQMAAFAEILLQENTSRLPSEIEKGLCALFSTLQVNGTRLTLGAPVPPSERTRDWARMHLLTTDPSFAGRSRVMFSNLENIPDLDPAYRNAFEKSAVQIEKMVDTYVAAGSFGHTADLSGKPLDQSHGFHIEPVESGDGKIALADLMLAANAIGTGAAYGAVESAEASEGKGLVALQAHQEDEARKAFAAAMASNSRSARAYFEAGLLKKDPKLARKDLDKAAELNPRWAEPSYRAALLETSLEAKAVLLKKACTLDPRNAVYWQALARNEEQAERFPEAQKAWGGAERAAATAAERDKIRQTRLDLEAARADHDAAERKRIAEEEARDLERVKNASHAAILDAEAAARKKMNPNGAEPPKPVDWWTGPEGAVKAEGMLQSFDCLGRQARLVVKMKDGKTVQLLVQDASQIAVTGGEHSLSCGPQHPARLITVQYVPKIDKKLGTIGEVASIEFR
jgi:hypothetical protein